MCTSFSFYYFEIEIKIDTFFYPKITIFIKHEFQLSEDESEGECEGECSSVLQCATVCYSVLQCSGIV